MDRVTKNITVDTRPAPRQHKNLFLAMLASDGAASSRRFFTLILGLLYSVYFLTEVVLMVLSYVKTVKASATVQASFFSLMGQTETHVYGLLLVGLGLITGSQLIGVFGTKASASVIRAASGQAENVVNQQVDTQNVDASHSGKTVISSGNNTGSGQSSAEDSGQPDDEISDTDLTDVAKKQASQNDYKQTNKNIQPKE